MFTLKDDEKELEIISDNKRYEEFKILLERVSMVLDGYRDQLNGLKFRMDRLNRERQGSIYLVVLVMLAEIVVIFFSATLPYFLVIGIPLSLAFYACFPFLLGSMVKRNFQYLVMMEKQSMLNYITPNNIITFKEEKRFINRKISEYEDVLKKYSEVKDISEDDIVLLDKLTRPESFYASPIVKDFKMWPFWVVTAFWVLFALIIL